MKLTYVIVSRKNHFWLSGIEKRPVFKIYQLNPLHLIFICAKITDELISFGLFFIPLRREVGAPHFSV